MLVLLRRDMLEIRATLGMKSEKPQLGFRFDTTSFRRNTSRMLQMTL